MKYCVEYNESYPDAYYESLVEIVTDTQLRCLKGIAEHNGRKVYSKEFLEFAGIRQPATVTQVI